MSSIYVYESLANDKHIRILSLYPAENLSDALRGELKVVNLPNSGDFEALSYTWGPPFEDQALENDTIEISGEELSITGNLGHALRRLRLATDRSTLWVDAICINQADPTERGHQVGFMADIFGSGIRVIAWLGEDSEYRDGEYFLEYRCDFQRFWQESNVDKNALRIFLSHRHQKAEYITFDAGLELESVFQSRRYFARRWVLQEQVVARDVLFVCGKSRQGYRVFLQRNLDSERWSILNLIYKYGVEKFRCSAQTEVVGRLENWQLAKCSDDRDIVLALASLWRRIDLRADYWMSTEQVYVALAEAIVKSVSNSKAKSTDTTDPELELRSLISAAAQQCTNRPNHSCLPSWVPDWRRDVSSFPWSPPLKFVKLDAQAASGQRLHITLAWYGELRSSEADTEPFNREYYLVSGSEGVETTQLGTSRHLDRLLQRDLPEGSIVCSVVKATRIDDLYRSLVLQPANSEEQEYRIIDELRLNYYCSATTLPSCQERRITIV